MKSRVLLPLVFVIVFALSRIPGVLPQNFSVAYAFAFCAGVYLAGPRGWWLPLGVLLATDIGLNFYYWLAKSVPVWEPSILKYQLINYVAYVVLIWLGRRFNPRQSFLGLLGGGILGALLFYLITNTASWLFNPFQNPEYTRNWLGWLTALIKGTHGWPQTWEFFRNTLLSGGLFTGLFVAAAKLVSAESPQDKRAGAPAEEAGEEEEPEEAGA